MDISEQRIKMADCPEIQDKWKPSAWDVVVCNVRTEKIEVLSGYPTDSGVYGHGIDEGDECPISSYPNRVGTDYKTQRWIDFKTEHIWLPRQDQLQEMVGGDETPPNLIQKFYHYCFKSADDGDGQIDIWETEEADRFSTMEQLWLAFLLKEKFGKVWYDGKWVVQT